MQYSRDVSLENDDTNKHNVGINDYLLGMASKDGQKKERRASK